MTGTEIRDMRTQLQMTVADFADLIGISGSSVHRWESAGPDFVKLDPMADKMLHLTRDYLQKDRPELARVLKLALAQRGALYAHYRLLAAVFGESEEPVSSRFTNRAQLMTNPRETDECSDYRGRSDDPSRIKRFVPDGVCDTDGHHLCVGCIHLSRVAAVARGLMRDT